ncbi:MAG TPA: acyl-CoA dehydrogenase [Acidimicrobiales bacterium]|nr:acyl-CoA dehydrogenase [Acidimicrobiales bacterium]
MAIAIGDAHRELADVARSFLQGEKARAAARALLDAADEGRPGFWDSMVELGWTGLHVPERYGGSGYGLPELAVVLEALGRSVAPGPFLPTVVLSAIIADCGSDDQRSRLLPGLVDGSTVAGLGLGGSLAIGAEVVDGDAGIVLGAGTADVLALAVGDDLAVVPRNAEGVTVAGGGNLDPTRRSAQVRLHRVALDAVSVLGGRRSRALAFARTLAAAEASGGARECVEMATDYAKARVQFGRVIGTYGPVKHHCANMLVAAELATAAAWDAARAASGDPEQFALASAVAATQALSAYVGNAQLNIQVHGGIGFTWEHDAHMLLRRAGALAALFEPGVAAADVARIINGGVTRRLDLELPSEADVIRDEVRALVAEVAALPAEQRRSRLIDAGLAMPHWPMPWGRAARAVEQIVIDQELDRAGVERPQYGITGWITLTLIQHASADQVERWVRPSLEGALVWCQLFSEPNAGSDAAGIRTRGTRVEGGWRVSGQKVWTSGAQYCQRGLATVRTDPDAPKHAGITMMVIDMHAEGVDVRPLREASGGAMFNEVFFDDVFVPDDDVVGPVSGGWTVARSTLGNERVSIGGSEGVGGGGLLLDVYRQRKDAVPDAGRIVGRLLAEAQTMRVLNLRRAERAVAGGEPGPEGNVTKLLSAEHAQRVADAGLAILGPEVALTDGLGGRVGAALIFSRALSIAGGTSEITRNQIGERILGLPRDPLVK